MNRETSKLDTIIVIEHLPPRLSSLSDIARHAAHANLAMRVIVPDTAPVGDWADAPFAIHQTSNWTTAGLEAAVRNIELTANVLGIGTFTGFFTPEGLLAAQVAELCQTRGLPHTPAQALYRANNKYLMRQALKDAQVYTVRFARVKDQATLLAAAQSVRFPLILKPVVGVASSFISRCDNVQDMQRVFEHYREHIQKGFYSKLFCAHEVDGERFEPWLEMLAEEAISGYELSVECLCTEDKVMPLMIHDKLDVEQSDYCSFENLLITPPIRLDIYQQQEVVAYTHAVVSALGLKNCFCHVELRYDARGRASVIEVNPRIGGMRVRDSLRTLRGIRFEHFYVRQLLGARVTLPYLDEPSGYFGMLAIYPRKSGTLKEVLGIEAASQLPGIIEIGTHVAPGAPVGGDYEEVFAVDAWFQADSPEGILELDRQVKSLVSIHVD